MLNADMAMWHACAVAAIWHAGMQIVLLSTHPTEIDQARPKNQFGTGTVQQLDYPQRSKLPCRHYENGCAKTYVRTRVCPCAPGSTAPLDTAKKVRQPGGAHSVRLRRRCAVPVACAAGRAGRAAWGKCMQICMREAWGASVKQCAWVVWCRASCNTLFVACPPGAAGGTAGWHLRAANLRAETCARTAGISSMVTCMDGMQQTACHEHV